MGVEVIAAIAAGIGALITAFGAAAVNLIKAKKEKTGDLELQYTHTETLVRLISNQSEELLELRDLVSNVREDLAARIEEVQDGLEGFRSEQKEINIITLRHSITQVYETYRGSAAIPKVIYESTLNLYDQYKKLGGNSYVDKEIEQMSYWEKT